MPSLQTIGRRFENDMVRADGFPFKAVVLPLDDSTGVSYDFSEPRLIVRLRHDSSVGSGQVVMDPAGRRLLLGTHDENSIYNEVLYKSCVAYILNTEAKWERPTEGETDPLTKLKRGAGRTPMGTIEALIEPMMRERTDGTIRVRESAYRLVTGAPVELGDFVNDMVVKRLDNLRGIWVGEIE